MAPQLKSELIILKITYIPFVMTRINSTAAHVQNYPPALSLPAACIWFHGVLHKERPKIPSDIALYFYEWDMRSNDANLFTVNDHRYDEIYVVLGGEHVYWFFYSSEPYRVLQGNDILELSYCACCINVQYLSIIEIIKNWMFHNKV